MNNNNHKSRLDEFIISYVSWIIHHRWLVAIVSVLLVLVLASGAQFLFFDTNYRVFFSEDNPQLQQFEKMQAVYTKNDNILFVLAVKDEVFSNQVLDAVEKLTEDSWQMPFSTRVDAITNFQYSYSEEDDLIVEDLVENALQKSSQELKDVKVISLTEPFLFKQLISENAKVTAVNVTLQFPGENITEVPESVNFARELAEKYKTNYPDIEIYITGMAMLNNAFSEASMGDMQTLVPLMYLAMILIMFFSLRSVSGTFTTVLIISFSTMIAMGVAGWFGTGLTPPTASAPTIIMTLAIADSIHILVTLLGEMRKGKSKKEAIIESIRINFQPVLLTSVSTTIGFLTMNFSEVPPFHHLGNITTVGIMAAFLFSVIFLPAIMSILPVRVKQKQIKEGSQFVDRIAEFVIGNKKVLLYGGALTAVIIGAFLFKNNLDDRFVEYFDDTIQFRRDTDFTLNNLTGIYQVEYSIEAGESEGISDPEYLMKLEEFTQWFRSQEDVVHVRTFTDVMKRLNRNMHGDNQEYYKIPDNRQLAAQYLLLYEMSLPFGLDLNNQINIDKSATRFIVTIENVDTKNIIGLAEQGENWLKENAPEFMFSYATGPPVMFAHISGRQLNSMIKGSLIALLLISIMLVFALKNFKIGIVSLIPNIMPAAVGFGLWGLTQGRVGIGLSLVMGMTLGIVVDDTVHFLSKYLRARRENNLNPEDAVRYAFSTVGKALIVTSMILVVGFGILMFSAFRMNSGMGQLTAMVLLIALVADFLFLPPLLIKLEELKSTVTTGKLSGEPVPVKVES
jgi:predicted RND superfamily exporter protein